MATNIGGLNVPPLQRDDRIEDWERLFRAAVVPLLAQDGGERLAIIMLPAFVCRRVAERKIAREVVNEAQTIDEAFKTLRDNLDPPVDGMNAMQEIRDKDWETGNTSMIISTNLRQQSRRPKRPYELLVLYS